MIFRKYTAVSLALVFFAATSISASAASGFPHFGAKKQQNDPIDVHKLTPSQSALIDRAIVREHAVVASVKERAPLVETYIQNMRPDPVVTQYPASDRYFLDRVQLSKVTLSRPIHCRTMLTEPLESSAIGNTILLSKSLIDSTAVVTQDGLQQAGNLNALLAFQLAHIILGHRLDTKFAFNDTLIFPTITIFNRISMHHSDADNAEAAKKAVQLLSATELVDGQQYFGLYLKQLQQQSKSLMSLNAPMLGDALVKSGADPTFWMAPLMGKASKLDVNDIKQQAAMPLDSFLRFDPWSDQVVVMHSSYEPILSAPDKIPLEVAPIYLKLRYFEAPTSAVNTRVISVVQSRASPDASEPNPNSTGKN